ncbi:MAG: hypothetical protein ORN26_01770, partial [Candidatus Pacebacteria bacterium]|nr:hypothetical protein [Candidatus Paceibacterota bacterium]
ISFNFLYLSFTSSITTLLALLTTCGIDFTKGGIDFINLPTLTPRFFALSLAFSATSPNPFINLSLDSLFPNPFILSRPFLNFSLIPLHHRDEPFDCSPS